MDKEAKNRELNDEELKTVAGGDLGTETGDRIIIRQTDEMLINPSDIKNR